MDDPTHDALFRVLAEPHRRVVCRYLASRDEGVANVDDLVDHVVHRDGARENVEPEDVGPEDRRRQVEIRLHHVHLPMLSDAGIVEFDARSGIVRYRGSELLEELLGHVADDEKVCA